MPATSCATLFCSSASHLVFTFGGQAYTDFICWACLARVCARRAPVWRGEAAPLPVPPGLAWSYGDADASPFGTRTRVPYQLGPLLALREGVEGHGCLYLAGLRTDFLLLRENMLGLWFRLDNDTPMFRSIVYTAPPSFLGYSLHGCAGLVLTLSTIGWSSRGPLIGELYSTARVVRACFWARDNRAGPLHQLPRYPVTFICSAKAGAV